MKKIIVLFLFSLVIVACTPAPVQNTEPFATIQPIPTDTARPTEIPPTKTPRPTNTPEKGLEEIREEISQQTIDLILGFTEINEINLFRVGGGLIEIEGKTEYASQDHQPDVSYDVVKVMCDVFVSSPKDKLEIYAGGDNPKVVITTYSDMGDYKYHSETDYATCIKVAKKQISYDEWKQLSGAGFE